MGQKRQLKLSDKSRESTATGNEESKYFYVGETTPLLKLGIDLAVIGLDPLEERGGEQKA